MNKPTSICKQTNYFPSLPGLQVHCVLSVASAGLQTTLEQCLMGTQNLILTWLPDFSFPSGIIPSYAAHVHRDDSNQHIKFPLFPHEELSQLSHTTFSMFYSATDLFQTLRESVWPRCTEKQSGTSQSSSSTYRISCAQSLTS